MPCYNERKTIQKNIVETVNTLKNNNNGSFDLIVIDDGSLDGTFEEIKTVAHNNGLVKYIQLEANHGKGYALKKGFQYAKGKYICFLDGDLDLHPRLIKTLLEYMQNESADVVIGSKRHPLSKINYPLHRRGLSFGYQSFVKALFNLSIMDSQVGLKIFKREVLEDVFPIILVKKYAFDIEVLVNAHRNGYKIVEAPIEMDFKTAGAGSDVGPEDYIKMFIDTCAIFYRTRILHSNGNISKKTNEKQNIIEIDNEESETTTSYITTMKK
jgi:glycosyltransferase involved in cell wall biosynthesis